jgi:hypothetical protein
VAFAAGDISNACACRERYDVLNSAAS